MNARSIISYTVLRLLFFLVPFGLMMLLPVFRELYWLAALFAALIGLSLSVIFLRRKLNTVTSDLAARRQENAGVDKATTVGATANAEEDAIVDTLQSPQTTNTNTE